MIGCVVFLLGGYMMICLLIDPARTARRGVLYQVETRGKQKEVNFKQRYRLLMLVKNKEKGRGVNNFKKNQSEAQHTRSLSLGRQYLACYWSKKRGKREGKWRKTMAQAVDDTWAVCQG